jgi:hypothetical protein
LIKIIASINLLTHNLAQQSINPGPFLERPRVGYEIYGMNHSFVPKIKNKNYVTMKVHWLRVELKQSKATTTQRFVGFFCDFSTHIVEAWKNWVQFHFLRPNPTKIELRFTWFCRVVLTLWQKDCGGRMKLHRCYIYIYVFFTTWYGS